MITKRAVVVGINDYPGVNADLRGCVNDALDWASALRDRGFNITMLLDSAATKAAIVEALQTVTSLSKARDRVVFTFSGHGTWVPDRDGDEADRRDEALVCHDYQHGGLIVDDELHQLLTCQADGVRVAVMSDSCHSGSVSRFVGMERPHCKPKFLPPATFLSGSQLAAAEQVENVKATSKPRRGSVLISGCADLEVSYDVQDGRPHGAFTAAALSTLDERRSYGAWHNAIRRQLPSERFPQTPQLTADSTQRRWVPLD